MSWDALGAIAGAAVGVIVSLLYLANQVRQSTRTERARAHHDIFSGLAGHTERMFGTENIDLVVSGMRDFGSLRGGTRSGSSRAGAVLLDRAESALRRGR